MVDAAVVVTAAAIGAGAIVTSDPDDLEVIADALGVRIRMRAV